MDRDQFAEGLTLLGNPVLPLASMVQFLYVTGGFDTVAEVVAELPAPIETGYATYADPQALLAPFAEILQGLHLWKSPEPLPYSVVDSQGEELDRMTAVTAMVGQQLLTRELEAVNSALCGPCGCTLCCTGPDGEMEQDFFQIPLAPGEPERFAVEQVDTPETRAAEPMARESALVGGVPFFARTNPVCVRFAGGWSLILPRESSCPALDADGRCRIYAGRPEVCRRPQVFPYLLEPLPGNGEGAGRYGLRGSLLAVLDCPYVQVLRDDIAAYGAACELETVFRHNKG